jgi:hypothetical protein
MWIRKRNDGIVRKQKRLWLSFRGPFIYFIIMFICGVLLSFRGPLYATTYWPSSFSEILCSAMQYALIIFVIAYIYQFISKKQIIFININDNIVICDKCQCVKKKNNNNLCTCGGHYDDIENWEWVDSNVSSRKHE